MSPNELIGFTLILLMMGIVFLATRFVASARLDGKNIYYITVNAVFRGNKQYQEWIKHNSVYLWCILLIASLCVTVLCLIPEFIQHRVFNKPKVSLIVSVPLWLAIYKTYLWFFKKLDLLP